MRYVKQTFVFFDQKSSSHVHVENYEKMNKMAVDVRSDVRTRKLTLRYYLIKWVKLVVPT